MAAERKGTGKSSERGDSTMEVLLDELETDNVAAPAAKKGAPAATRADGSLDALLEDLGAEVDGEAHRKSGPRPSQRPPPLTPRTSTEPGLRAPLPAPPPAPRTSLTARPPTIPAGGASPAHGLRRPASIPPPLQPTTATGMRSPARPMPPPPTAVAAAEPAEPADPSSPEAQIAVWERELAAAGDNGPRAARIHYEIARVAETQLRDLRRAAAHYQEALARAPEHVPTLRGARRVLIARKNYQQALPLFDAEARITADARRKASLYLAKGRLLEDVLGHKGEARQAYATALELDRGDASILKALEQCDQDAGAWSELARVWERAANAVGSDPKHRAALVVQRARVLETRQREVDAAIELYETALRLDPQAAGALEALKRLHHRERRWRDLIRVLGREADQTGDRAARTMALYRVARLHAERLGNREEAIAALERAAGESPDEPLVLDELARLYESAERWDAVVSVLERLARLLPPGPSAERIAALMRIGHLREERLNDAAGARTAYEAVLIVAPTHVPVLQALGKLYAASSEWDALVSMHRAEAENAEEPRRRAAAHARVAEILEAHREDVDGAIVEHKRALTLAPGYPPSFKALARLFAQAQRWRELVDLYARAVESAPEREAAITYLLKMGNVYEDALSEPSQAAHAYKRVLAIEPKHLGAIHALQRATERAQRWAELVEALELEAELSKDPRQVLALVHRAGEVLDEQLGDREAAMSRFRRVLSIEATYVPAITSLGRIYYRAGRWDDLLELYKRELDLTPRGPQAVAMLLKMGELCEERTGRDEDALAFYRKAIEIDPTSQPALKALARKLRERESWEELVRVLETELSGLTLPSARARTAYRVGEVWEERLGQADKAIAAYEASREADPGYRPAVDALARLRGEQGAWRKLVDELEREANTQRERPDGDPMLATAALLRAGEIWSDQLNEPRRAAAAYEKVLEKEPSHLGALFAIEALYRKLTSFDGLARVYAMEARVLADPGARVAALRELARVQEVRLGASPDELRATYEAILGLAPDDAAALSAMERIALDTGSRALLATVDARLVARAGDARVAAAYQTRLAESLEQAGDAHALDAFRAALDGEPDNLAAARGLSRVAAKLDDAEALAEAARREAAIVQDARESARLFVRAGRVTQERLANPRQALADYERALELWPDEPDAAASLLELLLAAGQGARACDRLARAAASARSPERAAELWLEVARLQGDLLDDVPAAIAALQRVLKQIPTNVPALRKLAELHEREEQWSEATQLLGRLVQLAPDRDVLRDAHLRLAAIWHERLGELSRALVSLQAVLSLEQDNRAALRRLALVHEAAGDLDKACDIAGTLVEASHATDQRAEALVELARLEQRRGRAESAQSALYQAIVADGPLGTGGAAFRDRYRDREGLTAYAQAIYEHLRRLGTRHSAPREVYLELATVLGDRLGRDPEAVEILREAVRAHHDDVELWRLLAARLTRVGAAREAVEITRRLLDEQITRADLWRDLRSAYHSQPEVAALITPVLFVLGAANHDDVERLRARTVMPARTRPGAFAPLLPAVYELDPHAPVTQVLAALPEAFSKLYPVDLEGYGLTSRDKITARTAHPMRALADRVASVFGVTEYDLYVHRVRARGLAVELTEPVSLLVPANIAELPEAGQVFMLARAFSNMAMRLAVADKLTPREIEVLVASAVRGTSHGFGSGLTSEDFLDEQNRRIQRALSRRARRALEEASPRYVQAPPFDYVSWARAIMLGASRAALLACDDLVAAVEVLRRMERDLSKLEGAALVAGSILVGDLVRFWASEQALELRRRAGMAI